MSPTWVSQVLRRMEKVREGEIPETKLHLLYNGREKRSAGVCGRRRVQNVVQGRGRWLTLLSLTACDSGCLTWPLQPVSCVHGGTGLTPKLSSQGHARQHLVLDWHTVGARWTELIFTESRKRRSSYANLQELLVIKHLKLL